MSLGPVMLDLEGTALNERERRVLQQPQVGGVILFSRNFESRLQLQQLVAEIRAVRQPPLLVAVDHEGGRVQRFRAGFSAIPAMARLGELYERNKKTALHSAEQLGWLLAAELRAEGVDVSFTPVLDLGRGISGVIGNRAFHRDPEVIARLAAALMAGMKRAGMVAVGKHFPGHGTVKEDSHLARPVDPRPLAELMLEDLIPFERLIEQGLAAMMPAHVIYPNVDQHPAGFSPFWLQQVLRRELKFQGVIFSDDLSMAAAAAYGDYPQRAQAALQAGCDMVLVCNQPEAAESVVASLKGYENPASQARLVRLHGRGEMNAEALRAGVEWQQAQGVLQAVQSGDDFELEP
ncbi:MAG: beta-N-acetylhexosaminidase [Gammaproteobacteria bacterium]|nr:beta-N-acetylhexosaminidase [Gammaproteobacteria bacterium]